MYRLAMCRIIEVALYDSLCTLEKSVLLCCFDVRFLYSCDTANPLPLILLS